MDSYSRVWRTDLQLKPSRIFLVLSLLLHGAAAAALLSSGLPLPARPFLLLPLLLSVFCSCRDEMRRGGTRLTERGTDWWLETAGQCAGVELQQARSWRYLVVMDFRGSVQGPDGRQSVWRPRVVILPDAVTADEFRRLRVSLRHRLWQKESL